MFNRIRHLLEEPTMAKLLGSGSVVLFFKLLGAFGGYVLLYGLTQAGGESAVGVFEVAFTAVLIGSTIGRFGLDTVIVRELGRANSATFDRTLYKNILFKVLAFNLLTATALYVLAKYFTTVFFDEDIPDGVLQMSAFAVIPFSWMLVNAEAYRGIHKHLQFSLNQHGTVYIFMSLVLLLFPQASLRQYFTDPAQWAMFLLVSFSSLFALLTTLDLFAKFRGTAAIPAYLEGKMYSTALPMLISSALFMVISWSDTLMLSYYLPEGAVGVYRIAFKIATLITFAQFALNTVVAPMVSGLHSGGEGMGDLARKVAHINLITAGPIFLVITIFGSFLLELFGISNVREAYLNLLVLSVGQLANAFAGPVLNILNMTGYEKQGRNTMLVTAGSNIVLNLLLIPLFGPLGAAIATSLTMVLWNVWAALLVYKFHGIIAVPFLARQSKEE